MNCFRNYMAFAIVCVSLVLGGTANAQSSWTNDLLEAQARAHQVALEDALLGVRQASAVSTDNSHRVRELEQQLETQVEVNQSVLDRLADHDCELDALNAEFDTLEAEFEALGPELDALEARVEQLEGRVGDLEDYNSLVVAPTLDEHDLRLDQLDARRDLVHLGFGLGGLGGRGFDGNGYGQFVLDTTMGGVGRVRAIGTFNGGFDGTDPHLGGSVGLGYRAGIWLPSFGVTFDSDRGPADAPGRVSFTTAVGPSLDVRFGENSPISLSAFVGYGTTDDDGDMVGGLVGGATLRLWAF